MSFAAATSLVNLIVIVTGYLSAACRTVRALPAETRIVRPPIAKTGIVATATTAGIARGAARPAGTRSTSSASLGSTRSARMTTCSYFRRAPLTSC